MNELEKLRKQFFGLLDEHAHDSMRTPAADPFNHGVQVGQYRAYEMVIEAITHVMKDEDTD